MRPASRVVLKAIAFTLGLVFLLLSVQRFDDYSDVAEVGYKTQEVRALRAETVFLGSSRTYRHVDVARFDSLQGGGNSYNFGLRGGMALEVHYLAEQMLDLPYVRRLVIEILTMTPRAELENRDNRRTYYYHDLRHAGLASSIAWTFDVPLGRRLEIIRGRYGVALDRYFLPGQGDDIITGLTHAPVPYSAFDLRGHSALDVAEGVERRRERFLSPQGQKVFARKVEQLRQEGATPTRSDSAVAAMWTDLYRRAKAQGVEVFFVEQIGEARLAGLGEVMRGALPPERLILINDPERYPELFNPDFWFDPGHLNQRGARRVTDVLARRIPPVS